MTPPDLWLVSVNAFVAVLALLAVLAGALRVLTAVFPPTRGAATASPPVPASAPLPAPAPEAAIDAATLAALHVVVARAYPGGRVTHVAPADEA